MTHYTVISEPCQFQTLAHETFNRTDILVILNLFLSQTIRNLLIMSEVRSGEKIQASDRPYDTDSPALIVNYPAVVSDQDPNSFKALA